MGAIRVIHPSLSHKGLSLLTVIVVANKRRWMDERSEATRTVTHEE